MTDDNVLVGRVLLGVDLTPDKHAIRFRVADGDPIVAQADADCCSHTWIEHVELPALGFPATVTAVDDIELPQPKDDGEYECLQVYGLKITTDRGEIVLDYRNESNGYYGGWLSWPPHERFYGGVYGQNNADTSEWVPAEEA